MSAPEPSPSVVPPTEPPENPPAPEAPKVPVSALPEDLRENPSIGQHLSPDGTVDVAGLAKSFASAQSLIGGDRIPLPGKDAPKDQWDQFFTRLGRPESPDKYELNTPEEVSPEIVEEKTVEGFRSKAHEIGLSGSQADALYQWFLQTQHEQFEGLATEGQAAQEKAIAQLRKDFGSAFEEKVKRGQAVVQRFGSEDLVSFLETSGLGSHPEMVKFMVSIGEAVSEDSIAPGVRGASRFGMTPEAAKAEINSLMADPAYTNPQDPRHNQIIEKIGELSSSAYPEAAGR